jgi:DNA mismatch repair protein MSH6
VGSSRLPPFQPASQTAIMVRGIEGNEMSTPRASSQKKQPASGSQSTKNQKSILGFFQKKSTNSPTPTRDTKSTQGTPTPTLSKAPSATHALSLTPQPSSDPAQPSSPIRQGRGTSQGKNKENGLHASATYPNPQTDRALPEITDIAVSSPSRKVCLSHRDLLAILTGCARPGSL